VDQKIASGGVLVTSMSGKVPSLVVHHSGGSLQNKKAIRFAQW